MSQMYFMRPYDYDKTKIATAIVGVCTLAISITTFLYFYLIWDDLILAAIFLATFLSASLISIIVAIIQHIRNRPKYYWGPAAYYPQQSPTYYQTQQQPTYSPNFSQRPYESWQQYQYYSNQASPYYATLQSQPRFYGRSEWPSSQNIRGIQQGCPKCNRPIRYVESYQRWYCDACNQWF